MEKCKKCGHTWQALTDEMGSYQCPICTKRKLKPGAKKPLDEAMDKLDEKYPEYRNNRVRRKNPKE